MTVFVQLTTAGADTGPFDLYSDATVPPYGIAFATGVSKLQLLGGYTSPYAPTGTTIVRVQSTNLCTNYIDIPLGKPSPCIYFEDVAFANFTDGTVDSITPVSYTWDGVSNNFPLGPSDSFYGTAAYYLGTPLTVNISSGPTLDSYMHIYIDCSEVQCIPIPSGFTGNIITDPIYVNSSLGQLFAITFTSNPCSTSTTPPASNMQITNNSSDAYISAITPTFYLMTGSGFPYLSGSSESGTHGAFSGNMTIYANGGLTPSSVSVYVNYSLVTCFNVAPGGPNPYVVPITLLDTDILEIVMEDGSC